MLFGNPTPEPAFLHKGDAGWIEMEYLGDSKEVEEVWAPSGRTYKFADTDEYRTAWVLPLDVNYIKVLGIAK